MARRREIADIEASCSSINSGPVVAGIIGKGKFTYDLWGDVVNTASRMESHGVGGSIQIAEATYLHIKDAYICSPRGLLEVKGKGQFETWFLIDRVSWFWEASGRSRGSRPLL